MRYIFNPITEALEAPDNPSPMYDNLGKRFNLVEGGLARTNFLKGSEKKYTPNFKFIDTDERYIMKQVSNITGKIKYVLHEVPYLGMESAYEGKFDKIEDAIRARNITEQKLIKKYKLPKNYFTWSKGEKKWFNSPIGKVISRADLLKEIKAGKTLTEIAGELYNKHKAYFDKLPSKTFSTGKRGFGEYAFSKVNQIRNALGVQVSTRYVRGQEPNKLKENRKIQKILAQSEARYDNVIKDIKNFIDKNKAKYKKQKYGGAHQLQEAVLDMLEKKYPKLLRVSEGSTKGGGNIIKGQRLIPKGIFSGDLLGGDYGHHLNLKRMVYKGLDLPFSMQDMAKHAYKSGDYEKSIKKLLPIAQEKKLLPKTYKTPSGNTVKLTARNYADYVRHSLTDPLFKIFGNIIRWSPEHPGGMTRAALKGLMDVETLTHVQPMQSFAEEGVHWRQSPNVLKGSSLDKQLTGLLRHAENASDAMRPKYLTAANKLSKKLGFKYGTPQTMYHWNGKNIVSRYPKLTLQDTMVAKTKAAIHNFIANKSMKNPNFKDLPIKLQNAIKAINAEDLSKGHKLIKAHLQDVIIKPYWKVSSDIKLNNFAGAINLDVVPAGVRNVVGKVAGAFGKALKILGPASLGLDVIPFVQARDLGIEDVTKVGGKNLAEMYLNLPRTIEDVFHVAGEGTWKDFGSKKEDDRFWKPKAEFGQRATVKALRETSSEDIIKKLQDQLKPADANLLVSDPYPDKVEIEEKIKNALEQKAWADSLPANHPLVLKEEEETVSTPARSFFTPIPTDKITGRYEGNYATGGPVVPRVAYKDGSNWLDKLSDDDVYNLSRGWRTDMKMDPDVMDRIKQKQILDAQAANEAGFKHRSQYEDTGSFIPEYVQDVVKKGFGTKEGLKYMGSKAGEGALEGFEWFIYQIPHLMKELDKRGLTTMDGQAVSKMQKYLKENKGKMNWMELMYTPNWGEEFLGFKMNDYQKEQMQKLKDRFGETEIPEGIASTGTAAELGTMFLADPFIIWGAGSKLSKLKGKKDKLVNVDETIDIGKRDFTKSVGAVGLTAFLATAFPFLFKAKKNITAAKNVAKVAETVKQFGNVRGMPDWLPSFILKAKNDGKLLSLPDKNYIEPLIYKIMLPVKRRYYTSTSKDRGIGKLDDNPITSRGEKDHWGSKASKMETRIEEVPVTVTHNPNTGEMTVSWTGTDNFGDDIERSFNYRAGETGSQNYAADELGQGTSKETVVVEEPEFQYTEPDYSSMGAEDTSPDSALFLDAYDDADEIVEAMEAYVKGVDDKFKTQAANEMKLYNETDIHYGDAEGRQTADGDWIEGDNNLPIKGSDDKGVTDVYHPNRKKKAMGGKASGPPPLSGPVPEGLRSLKPGAIYNEWIN